MSTTYRATVTSAPPLPPPDDPSLNAPTLTARMPDQPFDHDTLMASLEAGETQCIPILDNPEALALAMIDPQWYPKSNRIQNCGKLARIRSHSSGPCEYFRTEIGFCDCRFSSCCRDRKAKEIVDRWGTVIDHVVGEHHNARHVLMELRIPTERFRDQAESHVSQIAQDVTSFLDDIHNKQDSGHPDCKVPCFHGYADPYWVNCVGFLGNDLIVRVLIADRDSKGSSTISTDAWRRLWPNAKVSVSVGKHLAFRSAFNSLLKPLPLDDPDDCMQQEVLFYRMQLFRAHKASLTCSEIINTVTHIEIAESEAQSREAGELSVEDTTDNSDSPPISKQSQVKSGVPCPHCGGVLDHLSGSMHVGSAELREEMARRRRITLLHDPPG